MRIEQARPQLRVPDIHPQHVTAARNEFLGSVNVETGLSNYTHLRSSYDGWPLLSKRQLVGRSYSR